MGTAVASLTRMSRYLRPYAKKRGKRRTGSARIGSTGLTLFFAAMFFAGGALSAISITLGSSPAWWIMLIFSLAMVASGGAGLVYQVASTRMSAERRKALAGAAARMTPRDGTLTAGDFPTIPRNSAMTDSPGICLAYRLPGANHHGWAFAALLAGCLLLCAMVALFANWAVVDALRGQFDWMLISVSLSFLPPAMWLVRICTRRLLHAAHVGRTVMEISTDRLQGGTTCRVYFAQFGRLRMRRLRLTLKCIEKATYQQGTNTRSESREVISREVYHCRVVSIRPSEPLEIEVDLAIPPGAMHSFRAPRNEISWMLVAEGEPRGWPPFRRTFPLVVYPAVRQVRLPRVTEAVA